MQERLELLVFLTTFGMNWIAMRLTAMVIPRPSPGTPWNRSGLIRRRRPGDTVCKAVGRLIRADLIVIDDVGMLPVSPDATEALLWVVDAADERRSLAITSNLDSSGFDELMPKTRDLGRLLHHAHVGRDRSPLTPR